MAADLAVTAADLADYLRITDPDAEQVAVLENALADAQSQVQGYLGWPIPPAQVTETGCWPWPGGWVLSHGRIQGVVSTVAETYPDGTTPTGYFTVTYTYGLDVAADPELEPIWRFILRSAADSPLIQRLRQVAAGGAAGAVKSASTDGQSVTFESTSFSGGGGAPGSGAPGAAPTLGSLGRWRNRSPAVYQRRVDVPDPFTTLIRW
jgi:hypothetical protein